MNHPFARPTLALLLAVPLATQAVEIAAGTSEYLTFRDCIAGVTACDGVSSLVARQFGGSPGAYASAAAMTYPGYGTGSGSVSFSGVIGAPILRASVSSLAGKRNSTNSIALQSYTHTGAAPRRPRERSAAR